MHNYLLVPDVGNSECGISAGITTSHES